MKSHWLIKGDRASEFFYSKININIPKRRSKYILNDDGSWTSASEKLSQEDIGYFTDLFTSSQATYQFPNITCKKILTDYARHNLCTTF